MRSLLAAGLGGGLLLVAAAAPGARSLDGPVPGHTGGFGEPTCYACHADGPEPAPGGVGIEGLPERFSPGRSYDLALVLEDTPTRAAGFQLAVRGAPGSTGEGEQAGRLVPADERTRVHEGEAGVQYLGHTFDGVLQPVAGRASWRFRWTAPIAVDAVVFHAAGNLASDDASELGDVIRVGSWRLTSAEKRPAGAVRHRLSERAGTPLWRGAAAAIDIAGYCNRWGAC